MSKGGVPLYAGLSYVQGRYGILGMGPCQKHACTYMTCYAYTNMHLLNAANSIFQTPNTQLCTGTVCRLILHKQLGWIQDTMANSYVTITQTS